MKELVVENAQLRVELDADTGCPVEIGNKLTGEAYLISGDEFEVEGEASDSACSMNVNRKETHLGRLCVHMSEARSRA